MTDSAHSLQALGALLPDLESLYKDIHSHPELSMQEVRTAGIAAERLRAAGFEVVTGVGKTGVVGLLRNGKGPTVIDATLSNQECPVLPRSGTHSGLEPSNTPETIARQCEAPVICLIRGQKNASFNVG